MIMLQTVALVPYQEYIKIKFLPMFWHFFSSNSYFFCSLLQCSDLPFENFILHLHCGVGVRILFRALPNT